MVEIKRSYFVEILLACLLLKMVSIITAVAVIISRQTSGTPSCIVLLSCHSHSRTVSSWKTGKPI